MLVNLDLKIIRELKEHVAADIVEKLSIKKIKGNHMVEYILSDAKLNTKKELIAELLEELSLLSQILIADKLEKVKIDYIPKKELLIKHTEYSSDFEDNIDNVKLLKELLDKVEEVSQKLSSNTSLELYEKVESNKKTKYVKLPLDKALDMIIKVLR